MSEPREVESLYAKARRYEAAGLNRSQIEARLLSEEVDPVEVRIALIAIASPREAEPAAAEDEAFVPQASSSGDGLLLGLVILIAGIVVTAATEGHVIAYGAIAVGLVRIFRSLKR
jgi:hypothetical protein